jgi:hypothetical protein
VLCIVCAVHCPPGQFAAHSGNSLRGDSTTARASLSSDLYAKAQLAVACAHGGAILRLGIAVYCIPFVDGKVGVYDLSRFLLGQVNADYC